jgi:autotransporter-associated beta strand protein
MRVHRQRRIVPVRLIAAVVLLLVLAPAVTAPAGINGTWTRTTGGALALWSLQVNWSGGTVATAIDGIADFSMLDITADDTVHLDSARTIGQLKFGDTTPSNNWIIDNDGNAADILTLAVSSGSPTITVNNDVATISAVVAGTQGLTKSGAGTLLLSGNDTYSGTTTISAGTLIVGNANALGTTAAGTTISSGATLDLGAQTVSGETLSISGTGVGGNGALINSSASAASWSGTIGAGAAFSVGGNGNNITLSGSVNSLPAFVLTKVGNNTLTLSGATDNNNLGATVNSGTLVLGKTSSHSPDVHAIGQATLTAAGGVAQLGGTGSDQIFDLGTVAVTSGAFDTNGRSETFAALSLQGTGVGNAGALVNSAAADSTITPTNGTTLTANATIGVTQLGGSLTLNNAIGGNFGITKVGDGSLTLAGNNTFTGGLTINAGNVTLGNLGALNSSSPNSVTFGATSSGTLSLNGNSVTISDLNSASSTSTVQNSSFKESTATLTVHVNALHSDSFSGVLRNDVLGLAADALSLIKTGAGSLTLSGTVSNTLRDLTVNAGTVVLAKTNAQAFGSDGFGVLSIGSGGLLQLGGSGGDQIGDNQQAVLSSGAAFDSNGRSEAFDALSLAGTGIAGGGALVNSSGGASTLLATIALFDNSSIGVTQSAGSLTLSGDVIDATSPPAGLTKVGAGTLVLAYSFNNFSGGLTVQQGVLQVAIVNDAGTNGPLGNNTSVVLGTAGQSGAGQPIGTLEYTGGTASSTMPFTLSASNGAIQIDNAATNLTLTSTIGVTGEFIKAGPGALTLTANPTLSANAMLTISAGTLRFTNSGPATIGTGVTATVASGATLELAGSTSALSAGSHRVNVTNSSNSAGLLVSGTRQQVGSIDGPGTTQVNAGSDLTANHIIQSALVIGGTSTSPGFVTIATSDASGNPLDGLAEPETPLLSELPSSDGAHLGNSIGDVVNGELSAAPDAPLNSSALPGVAAVPEPSSLVLLAVGAFGLGGAAVRRRRGPRFRYIAAAVCLLALAPAASAPAGINGTWTRTTGGGLALWSLQVNWSGGTVATASDGIADFSTLDITADATVHLDSARTIGQLKFGDTTPSNDWILDNDGSAANILTLAVSSGSPTITVNNDVATISAVVAGTQGLTKSGAGTLLLSGNDTYSGTTTISAGTLVLGNASALGSTAAGTTISSGATLDLGAQAVSGETLSISGTGIGGNGALINSSASAATWSGTVGAGAAFSVGGNGSNITLSGSVNSLPAFVLTKVGNNTLTLNGTTDNSNLGATVNSGTLVLAKTSSHSPDVHAIGQATLTANGGTIQLGGSGGDQIFDLGSVAVTSGGFETNGRSETFATLSLQGTGIGNAGALVNSTLAVSTITPTNGTTLTANTTIGVTQSGGSLTLNNAIGGNFGIIKVGAGTLTLAGNNTFTGGLTINAGNVQLGNLGALNSGSPNSVTFGASSTGTLSLNGNSVKIGDLNGASSSSTVQNTSSTEAILTINAPNSDQFAGVVRDGGTAALSLVKAGAGSLTLNGNNSYSGPTDISGGTLVLGNANALGNTAQTIGIENGATLDLGGQTIANPLGIGAQFVGDFGALVNGSNIAATVSGSIGSQDFTVGGVGDITLSGFINSNGGMLTKVGGNTLTLSGAGNNLLKSLSVNSGTVVLAKTNGQSIGDFSGFGAVLDIIGGVVQLGGTGGNQIEDEVEVQVFSRAAFDTNGQNENFFGLFLEGPGIAGTGALLNSAAGASILNVQTQLIADTSIGVTQSAGSLTLNGPIRESSGSQALTKVGAGTLILASSFNNFSGGLTVQQGTVQVATINDASTNGPLGNNTSVVLGTAGQSGAGQPIGTLEYTGGTASSTMPFTLPASNGAFQIDNVSTNLTLTGTIGVSGEFIKTGPGTLTLTANPTLSANSMLLINGGTLRFSNSASATIGTGVTTTVASGAMLELAGSASAMSAGSHRVDITNSSNSAGVLVSGTHQQVGGIDGSGTTQVNAGGDLTADHIIQSALVIGGTSTSAGLVTIAASDASGNPLGLGLGGPLGQPSEVERVGSLTAGRSLQEGSGTTAHLSSSGNTDLQAVSTGSLTPIGSRSPVPEPTTLVLALLAAIGMISTQFVRHHFRRHTNLLDCSDVSGQP